MEKMNKVRDLNIISDEWLVIDRSNCRERTASCTLSKGTSVEEFDSMSKSTPSKVLAKLRPHVPFSIEELAFVSSLSMWTNCNVRVIGTLRLIEDEYYIESVEEPGGPYRMLLVMNCLDNLPLINEIIQVFGEINVIKQNNSVKAFIKVFFLKNIETGNLSLYIRTIDIMRPFIPLFINANGESTTNNNLDDSQYYHHHGLCDNDEYSNEDFCYDNDKIDF